MAGRAKKVIERSNNGYKCLSSMDIAPYTADNSRNFVCGSSVHPCMKELDCWIGIDEAGRGPVLGPMVYGVAFSPLENKDALKTMGFADSKTLSEEQRDSMFDDLNASSDKIGWMVHVLSPHYISTCMLRRTKYNLNELSHDTAIGLIRNVLDAGVKVKEVYLDTVGPPDKYQAKLQLLFPDLQITVSKKADSIYSIVSAASICAKVARDKALTDWTFHEPVRADEEYGSGYPGDPKTKAFLLNNTDRVFGFPRIVRFSWSTAQSLLDEKAAAVQWPDDEDRLAKPKKRKSTDTPSLESFLSTDKTNKRTQPHVYFTERRLHPCDSI